MRILLLSLVLLIFSFPGFGQETLEEEIQRQLDEYNKSSVSVAQDILDKYVNDQVMGTILEKHIKYYLLCLEKNHIYSLTTWKVSTEELTTVLPTKVSP